MIPDDLSTALASFVEGAGWRSKGAIGVGIVVTVHAIDRGLPMNPRDFLTPGGGQVKRLGPSTVNRFLRSHGINEPLSKEGGRSNRASPQQMTELVEFLNDRAAIGPVDMGQLEKFWADQARAALDAGPLRLVLDPGRNLRSLVQNLLAQAKARDTAVTGRRTAGAVLQHLIGAALDCMHSDQHSIAHHGHATADAHTGRAGDFVVGDTAIHVTTAVGPGLMERCKANIADGLRPLIITAAGAKLTSAESVADDHGLGQRVDIFSAEQFVATSLYELGAFTDKSRRKSIEQLVSRYNEIVESVETDPSLRIDLKSR